MIRESSALIVDTVFDDEEEDEEEEEEEEEMEVNTKFNIILNRRMAYQRTNRMMNNNHSHIFHCTHMMNK
jgi:hypothetical protein